MFLSFLEPLFFSQLLKASLRGGLTACYRSFCGREADASPYVALLERQLKKELSKEMGESSSGGGGREEEEGGGGGGEEGFTSVRLRQTGLSPEAYLRGCNSHLLDDPMPADYAIYLDVNSLYAASCESRRISRLAPPLSMLFFCCRRKD
jgi:hypothetical protein